MKKTKWLAVILAWVMLITILPVSADTMTDAPPFALYDAQEGGNEIPLAEDGYYHITYPEGTGTTVYFRTSDGAAFDDDCVSINEGPIKASRVDTMTYVFSVINGNSSGTHSFDLKIGGNIYRVQIKFSYVETETPEDPGSSARPPMPFPFRSINKEDPIEENIVCYTSGTETVFYLIGKTPDGELQFFRDTSKTVEGLPPDIRVEKFFVDDAKQQFCYKLTIPATMGGDFYCLCSVNGAGGDLDFDDTSCEEGAESIMLRTYDAETGVYGPFLSKIPEQTGTQTYGVFHNGVLIRDYTFEISSAVVPAPASAEINEDGTLTVTVHQNSGFWINFFRERPVGEVAFLDAAQMKQIIPVTIDGETYTLVWGIPNQGTVMPRPHSIGWGGEYFGQVTGPYQSALALFQNYGTMEQSLATDKLSAIKSVSAEVAADGHEILVSMEETGWRNGFWLLDYKLTVKPAALILAADVTIKTDAGAQQLRLSTLVTMSTEQVTVVDCEKRGLDTVEKLNSYIAKEMPLSPDSTTILQLIPGHTYEGTIIANRAGKWVLQGTKSDKNPTIIKGSVQVNLDFTRVTDLLFLAPEGDNTNAFIPHGGSTGFRNCAFFGYDVALKGAENGRADATNCLFVKNVTAISLNGGSLNFGSVMTGNTFLNNGCAVDIQKLPDGMVPFDVRFTNSDFINNNYDIRVPGEGNYYAHGNYFGHDEGSGTKWRSAQTSENVFTGLGYKHPLTPAKNDKETWWLWHLSKNNNILKPNSEPTLFSETADTALDIFLKSEDAPKMTYTAENPLTATGTTTVRSEDTAELQISTDGLTDQMEIHVADSADQITGTWLLGSSLPSEEIPVLMSDNSAILSRELHLGMDVWSENGTVYVYVNDSLALRNTRPLIKVPCRVGANAVVTLDGEPTASFGEEDSVTFQTVQGGTYEIRPGTEVTLSATHSTSDSGLAVEIRIENWSAESCSGTPFCAVYDSNGKFLSLGSANDAVTLSSSQRSVVSVLVPLTTEQQKSASVFKLYLLDQSHAPATSATAQTLPTK